MRAASAETLRAVDTGQAHGSMHACSLRMGIASIHIVDPKNPAAYLGQVLGDALVPGAQRLDRRRDLGADVAADLLVVRQPRGIPVHATGPVKGSEPGQGRLSCWLGPEVLSAGKASGH